jgi:hypothetical protein
LISFFIIIIFLSGIIYKFCLLFQFHPSSIFSSFKFSSSYFYYYLFCLKSFFKLLLFTISPFFFPIRFDPYSFDCQFFFGFGKFFKLIFLNWFVIHFLIEPGSSVSQVAGFKNLTKFRMVSLVHSVFFSLSKLFFFSYFIIQYLFNWKLNVFLACFLWNFLLVLKMTRLSRIFLWNFLFFYHLFKLIYFNFIIQYLMY